MERRPIIVEKNISKTKELRYQSNSVGFGIIVMNAETGEILIGEEPADKFINGYHSVRKGDKTHPLESRKEGGELDFMTIQAGAIEEFLGSTRISDVRDKLYFMSNASIPQFFPEAIKVNGTEKRGSLVILMYDPQGNDVLAQPTGDLLNLQWMSLTDALEIDNLRTHAGDFLHVFCNGQNPSEVMQLYRSNYWRNIDKRVPLFDRKFDRSKFVEDRKKKNDIFRTRAEEELRRRLGRKNSHVVQVSGRETRGSIVEFRQDLVNNSFEKYRTYYEIPEGVENAEIIITPASDEQRELLIADTNRLLEKVYEDSSTACALIMENMMQLIGARSVPNGFLITSPITLDTGEKLSIIKRHRYNESSQALQIMGRLGREYITYDDFGGMFTTYPPGETEHFSVITGSLLSNRRKIHSLSFTIGKSGISNPESSHAYTIKSREMMQFLRSVFPIIQTQLAYF